MYVAILAFNFCVVKLKSGLEMLIKVTHTVYFSSSLYIINQKPMIPRIHFYCITTWVARSSG